ncbi:MAG: PAS domain S-box protein [Gemmatimonadaceae bacterium]
MLDDQPRIVEALRGVHRSSTAIIVLGALVFVSAVVVRREVLRRAALESWASHSSIDARLSGTSANAWLAARQGETKLLATAAARTPDIFGQPPGLGKAPITTAELSRSLEQSLSGMNQLHAYSAIWLLDASGRVTGSTSRGPPPAVVQRVARAALTGDSGSVSNPYVDSTVVSIAFARRVELPTPVGRDFSAPTVIGSVILVANASTLLDELASLGGQSANTTSLVVGSSDSVTAFALTPKQSRGRESGAWRKDRAPAFARAAYAPSPDSSVRLQGSNAEFSSRIAGVPWALLRIEPLNSVFEGINGRLSTEASTAAAVIFMIAVVVIARRQTTREQELVEVAESELRYRLLADNATDVIARHAPDGRILYISPAVSAILGYQPRQIEGHYPSEFFHEDDPTTMDDILEVLRTTNGVSRAEHRLRHADGHYVWLETAGRAVRDPVWNKVTELVTVSRDIEDRKKAESALRASEEDYRMLFQGNPLPMWAFDADTYRFVAVNAAAVSHYGYSRDEFSEMTIFDIRPENDVPGVRGRVESQRAGLLNVQGVRHRKKDGTVIEVDLSIHELELSGRKTRLVLAKDVTEARLAATALRDSNELIRALFDSSPLAIVATDLENRVIQWNGAAERLFGWTAAEVIGKHYPLATPSMIQDVSRIREKALRDGTYIDVFAQRVRKDGSPVDLSLSVGVIRDAWLEPSGFVLLAADVSDRAKLEAQVRHAQKMDAVGQLAGGVAHDFNNLLTVVTGYAGMVLSDLPPDSPIRADVAEILSAADRAGELTHHLLAFSRQQILRPRVIDLNPLVTSMEQMLRRVLTPNVELVIRLDPLLGTVNADPGQVEQVLMNLILNARDAMLDTGTITIETRDARLGVTGEYRVDGAQEDYVTLSVSDNGHGMTSEVQARIFEPFFTTKTRGEGSGLGLSIAHGIVAQSGGRMTVVSRPGSGTTVTVWLPRLKTSIDTPDMESDLTRDGRGAETILIVEDDPAVRVTTRRLLERAGYNVLDASDGKEGLAIHTSHAHGIDLLLTDMVMPGMNGRELVSLVHEREPDLAVLLMSGYADHASNDPQVAPDRCLFIDKPFTLDALLQSVRRAIDSKPTSSARESA